MSDAKDLVDRYIAIWNDTDAASRRALIARTWTEDASYVDPLMQGDGHDGLDAMIAGVQQRFPDFRFSLLGAPDAHGDRLRFGWALGPQGGAAVVKGTDFAVVAGDGRLQAVTGFLDQVPAH
ncbi:MAG: nuclear transport factor 2 family protein [Reyranellaceae bacterium]